MTSAFTHLHVHSEYSLLEGAIRIKDLVAHCKKNQLPAVALTDNGVMYGAIDFYLACKSAGIKPIIGCDMFLTEDITVKRRDLTRLVLLAKNYEGYQNLSELVTISHVEGFYYKPRIDIKTLEKFSENLIVIAPTGRGPIGQAIRNNDHALATELAQKFKSIYKENFYMGVQSIGASLEDVINSEVKKIADAENIPLTVANDVYYLTQDDAINRDLLMSIQFNRVLDEDGFTNNEQYFISAEEAAEKLQEYPDAIKNTAKIADACNVEFDTDRVQLPNFDCPDNLSPMDYLKKLVMDGLSKLYPEITEEITERAEFELMTIEKMGYPVYFLIIYDFLKYCVDTGIPIGPGRGSAAGSIVAYALGITKIDPLRYNLLFERFLNPERVSMPDIDLDFCIKRRGEVIDYIVQKYGEDRVAQIATFGTMQSRAVVRDVGRVLDIPLSEVDRIAKLIPATPGKYTSIAEAIETVPELAKAQAENPRYQKLLDYGQRLEGFARHSSTHAAGVVISRDPLSKIVPLISNDGSVATQYSMTILEKIGLLKMDILGLRNLTVLEDARIQIKEETGTDIDLDKLPLDDEKTYEILQDGKTQGIFQLESSGMRGLIKDLVPDCFEDIIALLALYRPGPLGSGMVGDFISNKSGKTQVSYDIDVLEPVLKDTYGMILYQEQVMQIASVIGGFTLAQADMLRRAMGKKKKEEMDRLKDEFLAGAKEKGFLESKAKKIFELCYKFAEYGFNKSHSAAYAMISYQTAYLKARYPNIYMTALLSSVIGNTEKCAGYMTECREMDIPVLPPDVNFSNYNFTNTKDGIRFGLGAIKNVGEGAIESIVENRKKDGPYKSLLDLCSRVDLRQTNKRVIESLAGCGAFDSINPNRAIILSQVEPMLEQGASAQKEKTSGQSGLFSMEEIATTAIAESENNIVPLSEGAKLKLEKELTGLYISGHPLDIIKDKLDAQKVTTATLTQEDENRVISLIGILTDTRRVMTKTKREMLVGTLEDLHGTMDVVVFQNDSFEALVPVFQDDNIVSITGRLRFSQDRLSLTASEINVLTDMYRPKDIHIDITHHQELAELDRLRELCRANQGDTPIYLHTENKTILIHRKYWINRDAKEKITATLNKTNVWEA